MKCLLLLPDFNQSGEIRVWGDGMSTPMPVSLCEDIPLRELPDCFVLGIPESLLRAHVEQDFVYAQYARLASKKNVLSYSIRGGNDKSGRTIVLTIFQLLNDAEKLKFPPEAPQDLPLSISEDERHSIGDRIEAMMKSLKSDSTMNIKNMISAVEQFPKFRSFASEYSYLLAKSPQWTPRKKKAYSPILEILIAFVLLAILIVASIQMTL